VTDIMTDTMTAPGQPAPQIHRPLLQFTLPGCRTELRLGALLVLAGTFLWNFVGPAVAIKIAILGLPLVLVGAITQTLAARRGVDAYPWKMAVAMLALGVPMCFDFRYRDAPGDTVHILLVGPFLAASGAWLAIWWPISAILLRRARAQEAA